MDTATIKERLEKLDSTKLIDIVKNFRQYAYSNDIRAYAITLLEQQGISQGDLQLTGNLENTNYNHADDIFSSYKRNSLIAFITYCIALTVKGLSIYHFITPGAVTFILFLIMVAAYLIFLISSFLNQKEFYKFTGADFGSEGIIIYLLFGMPFYIVTYFIFQKQMKERMNLIR